MRRWAFHPLLGLRRGWRMFMVYGLLGEAIAAGMWWRISAAVDEPGLGLTLELLRSGSPAVFMVSLPFWLLAGLAVGVLAAGMVNAKTHGPYQRIERCLDLFIQGNEPNRLAVREDDPFRYLVALVNEGVRVTRRRTRRSARRPVASAPARRPG